MSDVAMKTTNSLDASACKLRFDVALSFPGEKRAFVAKVAEILSTKIGRASVLYDDYLTAELARPNLDTYLGDLYRNESHLLVPFFCEAYDRKEWCGLEWRQMRDIIKKKGDASVMPFRFDDSAISGILSIDGYVSVGDKNPQDVATLILQRVEVLHCAAFDGPDSETAHAAREMSADELKVAACLVLLLLAQTYYKLLECVTGSNVYAMDLQLNEHYLWTTNNITNLLKNECFNTFPEKFEPLFVDLYPSTVRDCEWNEFVAPHAEGFLSAVQRFVRANVLADPKQGTPAWIFVELFRPSVEAGIGYAVDYSKRMTTVYKQLLTNVQSSDSQKPKENLGIAERSALVRRIATLAHSEIDALIVVAGVVGVPSQPTCRMSRAAKVVEWACNPEQYAVPSLLTAARELNLPGFA